MNLLVDTHILLWTLDDTARLGPKLEKTLISPSNIVWVSSISIWEISIKSQMGKLKMPPGLLEAIQSQGMAILPFTATHAMATTSLSNHHRDPFDRALMGQCIVENCTLITADSTILQYKDEVKILSA